MSVGGIVTYVSSDNDFVYIDTDDAGDKCAIYVQRDSRSILVKPNDIVWWQGLYAYWTSVDRTSYVEVRLTRVGYSGVKRPVAINVC